MPPAFMCVVEVHILDDAHVGAENGLRMLATQCCREDFTREDATLEIGGSTRRSGSPSRVTTTRCPPRCTRRSSAPSPVVWAESRWQNLTLERIGR